LAARLRDGEAVRHRIDLEHDVAVETCWPFLHRDG